MKTLLIGSIGPAIYGLTWGACFWPISTLIVLAAIIGYALIYEL